MKLKRLVFVGAFVLMGAMNFSCETESTDQVDEIYGLDKKEVTNEDT